MEQNVVKYNKLFSYLMHCFSYRKNGKYSRFYLKCCALKLGLCDVMSML